MRPRPRILFKLITRSTVTTTGTFLASLPSPNIHFVRHLNIVKMRELLINKSNNPIEIPQNKCGKNDYISTILQSAEQSRISLEVSPNSDFRTDALEKIGPRFVAVTWLGNTHLELPTHELPAVILARKFCQRDWPVVLHLAGRNVDKERMLEILTYLKDGGIRNIFALQGDWPHILEHDDSKCDFPYASDLVLFIKENFGDAFCVGVAGYPNVHPHCQSQEEDMTHLKEKISNGADFIITQASFDYEAFEKFALACKEHNINVPILAGIFVIKSYKALINIAKCCEFKVSQSVFDFVKKNRENGSLIENYGLDLAANLIRKCAGNKELFAGAHLFSMNDMDEVEKVLSRV